jgi:UDP-N-acetylglucosamine 2-epimerase (non-hydrolysing)
VEVAMRLLICLGTRPEAIKLAPLVHKLRETPEAFEVAVCLTAQHREMLDQVMGFFGLTPEYDLNIMKGNQTLYDITTAVLTGVRDVIRDFKPHMVLVQGDTTTTFASALTAFYERVQVAHVEAGLRSFDKYSPFPEEVNRLLTSHIAHLHFAPTTTARDNLLRESIAANRIFVVGNTSIDALFWCLKRIGQEEDHYSRAFSAIRRDRPLILVTGHRRESFGGPFREICFALKEIASARDVEIVYPVHLNPNVRGPVFEILKGIDNIHLIEPLDYPHFVYLMNRSYLILTDSGGVQEEAPSLGKPVLVMRNVTERTEGIEAGTARLVGSDYATIVRETLRLIDDSEVYEEMAHAVNPYGDGTACEKIAGVLRGYSE